MYPRDGVRSISFSISWAASPAPTTITSLPRATIERPCGRSMIVRTSILEPATSARVRRTSIAQTVRGTLASCTSKNVKMRKVTNDAARTPRAAPHMSRVET